MSAPKLESVKSRIETVLALAGLLERVERAPTTVGADQYQALVRQLPSGDIRVPLADAVVSDKSGVGWVEGWRGEILITLESGENNRIHRCHAHDPSWQNWPALEHAVKEIDAKARSRGAQERSPTKQATGLPQARPFTAICAAVSSDRGTCAHSPQGSS